MSVQHDLGAEVPQVVPERSKLVVAIRRPRGCEVRTVPERECAKRSMVGQVVAEPDLFWRACLTAAYDRALRIQRDQVPASKVEAVVTGVPITRRRAEVVEVAGSVGRAIVVAGPIGVGDV